MTQTRSFYSVVPVLRDALGAPPEVGATYFLYARSPIGAANLLESMADATRKGFLGCHDVRGHAWPEDARTFAPRDKVIVTPVKRAGAPYKSISLIRGSEDWQIAGRVMHSSVRRPS